MFLNHLPEFPYKSFMFTSPNVAESGKNFFAESEILGFGRQLEESRILLTIGIQNPSSTDKGCNPVPGIRNPWRGIQNPRLSCFLLRGTAILRITQYQTTRIKTETTSTLSNFDFQWTKILYQNNLKHIAFLHTLFKGYRCNKSSVVTPKKSLTGARENECQISRNYILHMKFSESYLCNHNSCEIWHSFSRTSMRNFLWCYYRWFITSYALDNFKKNTIFFKLFWCKVFVHWKLKLLNFPVDTVLNSG